MSSGQILFGIEGMPDLEDFYALHIRPTAGVAPRSGWPNEELTRVTDAWYQMSRGCAYGIRISGYQFRHGTGDEGPSVLFDAAGANLLEAFPAVNALVRVLNDQLATLNPRTRFTFILGPG